MRVKSLSVDKKITNILKYTKHRSILWIVSTTNELKQNMENCMMLHQQMIKTKNKKALYDIVSNNDGISRAGLAHKTKLSKSTISLLVDELITDDMLIDIGVVESGLQGRKPNGLRVNAERFILIANVRKRSVEIHTVNLLYETEGDSTYPYDKKLDVEYLSGIIMEQLI